MNVNPIAMFQSRNRETFDFNPKPCNRERNNFRMFQSRNRETFDFNLSRLHELKSKRIGSFNLVIEKLLISTEWVGITANWHCGVSIS